MIPGSKALLAFGLGLSIGACFNAPRPPVQFSCDPVEAPQCPPDYTCESDGCCHLQGSDVSQHQDECKLGGALPPTGGPSTGSGSEGGSTTSEPSSSSGPDGSGSTADSSGSGSDSGSTAGSASTDDASTTDSSSGTTASSESSGSGGSSTGN